MVPLVVRFLFGLLLHWVYYYHFQLLTEEGQGIKYLLAPQGMNWTDFYQDKKVARH